MLAPVLITAPAADPVTLAEAKAHLRVEFGDDDALIAALIKAATAHLDGWTGVLGRCLVNQQWRVQFPEFPRDEAWRLPFPDVSAAAIAYRDASGAEQTVPSGEFVVLNDSLGGVIWRVADGAWPVTQARPDAVTITLTAGYGAAAGDVPGPIRSAILLLVGDLFRNREAQVSERMRDNPAVNMLLAPYRRAGL